MINSASHKLHLIQLPAEHPCYAGHFPNFPVVPAVVLLDYLQDCVRSQLGANTKIAHIRKIKFTAMLKPGDCFYIGLDSKPDGSAKFKFYDDQTQSNTLASGSIRLELTQKTN